MATLEEIKQFVSGTVVNVLSTPVSDYPYYYLGEEPLGWAEYIDFSNFNPFELLGFTEVSYSVEVTGDWDEDLEDAIDNTIGDKPFSEALAAVKELSEKIRVSVYGENVSEASKSF
jgi:hypothetical protein